METQSNNQLRAVNCQGINKHYGNVHALNEVSFYVKHGELFGLIGADGAGKTTLFRILASLILADSGKAWVDGFDVVNDFRELRQRIGYMPGRFSLYPDLSVEENLKFFASVFNTSIRKNYHLIKDIYQHIEPFKNRRAGKLSGGMKQKLALSCALIHKPSVLLLDEPTTGVDPVSRKEFWEILRNLKNEGITIIVSTPYMDEATLCDRIALIQHGKILSVETPEGIVAQFKRKLFSVESNNNYLLLSELRKNPDVASVYMFGQQLHVVFNDCKIPELKDARINEIEPTIEDCFMALMKTE
jgi:ABC-type multidrug transport system ATPase subunit